MSINIQPLDQVFTKWYLENYRKYINVKMNCHHFFSNRKEEISHKLQVVLNMKIFVKRRYFT